MNSTQSRAFSPSQLPPNALDLIRIEKARRATERDLAKRNVAVSRDANSVRERCKSLSQFIREAWPNIPELANVPYVHGWHIDFICAHLEAVTSGKLLAMGLENRLRINVPPGTMKSLLISVFWPAWEWAHGFAYYQYVVTSYREDYCTRDTRRMRDLVLSDWYQRLYGKDRVEGEGKNKRTILGVQLVDKGVTRISNTAGGWREGIPWESLTGARGDRVIIDDPQSTKTGESEKFQERDERTFRESVTKRINDPTKSAIIVVQQRLHVSDTSGLIDKFKMPYLNIVLPMRFEPERRCITPVGKDPRRREGELLFPERFPLATVYRDEAAMTQYSIDGQHQQRPSPRAGRMFKREWFTTVPGLPMGRIRRARGWDLAASVKKTGKFTAGVRMSLDLSGIVYIEHVRRGRFGPGDNLDTAIKGTAAGDDRIVPDNRTRQSLPQDPGAAGLVQKVALGKLLAGRDVHFSPESGEKRDRALPLASQAELGNVRIVETGDPEKDAWIEIFLDELMSFPTGEFTDQGDAASRAYGALLGMPVPDDGILFVDQVGTKEPR